MIKLLNIFLFFSIYANAISWSAEQLSYDNRVSELQEGSSELVNDTSTTNIEQKKLFRTIQVALFENRNKLLSLIRDGTNLEQICKPVVVGAYEKFQSSLYDQLDALWYFETYQKKYNLTGIELDRIARCISYIDKYMFDYDRWLHESQK